MSVSVGINGTGRIGRSIIRAMFENGYDKNIRISQINNLGSIETFAHLLRYDSTFGKFNGEITTGEDYIKINNQKIDIVEQKDIKNIKWEGVDVLMECTGIFNSRINAEDYLKNGAKKVLISAPAKEKDVKTVVYGVNHKTLKADDVVVSCGSCTTNCLAPVAKVLNDKIGIEKGFVTTVHAYTNDQVVLDGIHKDLRRARSCGVSMIPTSTGAAKAIGLVVPELDGKLDGSAIRVPLQDVSMIDFKFTAAKNTSSGEVNEIIKEAAQKGDLAGILGYTDEELVSIDFLRDRRSSIFDSLETKVLQGNFIRVVSWYDNEWGFSNRMLDVAAYLAKLI